MSLEETLLVYSLIGWSQSFLYHMSVAPMDTARMLTRGWLDSLPSTMDDTLEVL
jgi:hypothetical protein